MAIDKPKTITFKVSQLEAMIDLIKENRRDLLLSPICRQYLAKSRFEIRGRPLAVFEDTASGVMPGTVAHNKIQIDDGTFASSHRTLRLINPLSSIEAVFRNAAHLRVLSIGPRTEMELLHLVAVGFQPKNVSAVDLISTSPWIDPGDMHALPYADRSFDVTISSWVLGYSRDPQKAVDEMVRVTKDGGLIAIGCTYNANAAQMEYAAEDEKIVGTIFRHVRQYVDLLGAALSWVHFQEQPQSDSVTGAVMIIARINHPAAQAPSV